MTLHSDLLPAVPFLRNAGEPYLEGIRCTVCGEVLIGAHKACPACGARGSLQPMRLANQGVLHSYSIVHRSFPGVVVPFVSAVVALDGGGFLKGTLVDVKPAPEAVWVGRRVAVAYREAGRTDAQERRYLTYVFVPYDQGAAA